MSTDKKIILDPTDPDVQEFAKRGVLGADMRALDRLAEKIAKQMPPEQPEQPRAMCALVSVNGTRYIRISYANSDRDGNPEETYAWVLAGHGSFDRTMRSWADLTRYGQVKVHFAGYSG